MATIAEQLTELQAVKSGLKTAIATDGADMSAVPFTDYPGKVQEIVKKWQSLVDRTVEVMDFTGTPKTIGDGVCFGCKNLKRIIFQNGVNSISDYAFYNCSSLEEILIPDSIVNIKNSSFRYCSKLKNVTIPDLVTNIGPTAFRDCKSLERLVVGSSVNDIGTQAFDIGSSDVPATIIMKPTTPPQIASNTIGSYVTKIIVPVGTGDTYKAAPVWSNYASIIEEGTA